MLTKEKIGIYRKLGGDADLFARTGSLTDKSLITDNDWKLIDNFIQDLMLIKSGLVSEGYKEKTVENIKENIDTPETITELKQLL